jgi:hypothetical protein
MARSIFFKTRPWFMQRSLRHFGDVPTVALVAHYGYFPEAPPDNVQPQVIEDYAGE